MPRETRVSRIATGEQRIDTLVIVPALKEDEREALIEAIGPLAAHHVTTEADTTYVAPDNDTESPLTTDAVRHDVVYALMNVRMGQTIFTPGSFRERPR